MGGCGGMGGCGAMPKLGHVFFGAVGQKNGVVTRCGTGSFSWP